MTTELRHRTPSQDATEPNKLAAFGGNHLVRSDSFNSLNGDSGGHGENGVVEDRNDDAVATGAVLRQSSRTFAEDKQDSDFYTYISPGVKAGDAKNAPDASGGDAGGFRLHIPSMYSKDSEQVAVEAVTDVKPLNEKLPDVEQAQRRREMRRLSRENSLGSRRSSGIKSTRDSGDEGLLKQAASLSRKLSIENRKEPGSPKVGTPSGVVNAPKTPSDVKPADAFKISDDLEELEREFKAEIQKITAARNSNAKPAPLSTHHILSNNERRSALTKTTSMEKSGLDVKKSIDGFLGSSDPSIMHALTGHVPFGDVSYSRSTSMLEVSDYSTPTLAPPTPSNNYSAASPRASPRTDNQYLSTSPKTSPLSQPGFSLRSAATEFLTSEAPATSTLKSSGKPTLNRSMSNISNWSDTESNCSTGSKVKDIAGRFGGQSKSIKRQYSLASAPGFSLNRSGGGGDDNKSQYGGSVKSAGGRVVRKAESMSALSVSQVQYAADLESRLKGLMKPVGFSAPKQPLWMRNDRERRRKIASDARKKWNMSDYGQLTMPVPSPAVMDNDHNNLKYKKALKKFQVVEGGQVSELQAQEARWKAVFEDKAAMFEAKPGEKEIDVRNRVRRSLSNRSLLRQMSIESEKGLDDVSIY